MDTFFVGWGGLALINAALANMDRRGPLKYLLASLLLRPLITVMLAATREDQAWLCSKWTFGLDGQRSHGDEAQSKAWSKRTLNVPEAPPAHRERRAASSRRSGKWTRG